MKQLAIRLSPQTGKSLVMFEHVAAQRIVRVPQPRLLADYQGDSYGLRAGMGGKPVSPFLRLPSLGEAKEGKQQPVCHRRNGFEVSLTDVTA